MLIQECSLRSNGLTSIGGAELFNYLRSNITLNTLILEDNSIGDECMHDVGEILSKCSRKFHLVLDGNKISDNGIETLSYHLLRCSSCVSFSISNHPLITMKSFPVLLSVVEKSNISTLNIDNTSIPVNKATLIHYILAAKIRPTKLSITDRLVWLYELFCFNPKLISIKSFLKIII